jgi:hypothetical protein
MTELSVLARRWMRQTELGRGIKLNAKEHQMLNAELGVGEILAAAAAKSQRYQCKPNPQNSIPEGDIGLIKTASAMARFGLRSTKSSGMTKLSGGTAAVRQALIVCGRRSSP